MLEKHLEEARLSFCCQNQQIEPSEALLKRKDLVFRDALLKLLAEKVLDLVGRAQALQQLVQIRTDCLYQVVLPKFASQRKVVEGT